LSAPDAKARGPSVHDPSTAELRGFGPPGSVAIVAIPLGVALELVSRAVAMPPLARAVNPIHYAQAAFDLMGCALLDSRLDVRVAGGLFHGPARR